jgi:DNA-binding beta-propeller fold protein YncE
MKKLIAFTIACIFLFSTAGEVLAVSEDFSEISVELTSTTRQDDSITAWWHTLDGADGYEIQYSSNRFFRDTVPDQVPADASGYTFTDLSDSNQYYFRIRAFCEESSGDLIYTDWTHSENALSTLRPLINQLNFDEEIFEIRSSAGQKVGYYDTLQGGCSDGEYVYFALYNRKKEKCKIAKFDLATGEKIKVSKVLSISHGNDLTYNSAQDILVAVHSSNNGRKVSLIDPETLKIISHEFITLDTPVPGMSEKRRKAFKGIGALAYNEQYDQYVGRVKNTNDLLFMDDSFNAIRYVSIDKPVKQTFQGMDTVGEYVLVGQSFKKSSDYNMLSVYDWQGNYISRINIKKGYELECLFHTTDKFYAGFYRSYYKTYYTTAYKKVVKNGKKVRVKTKVKKKKLMRDNYIYKIDKF